MSSNVISLSPDLISSITCDKCCEDGYNVENLLPSSQSQSAPTIFPKLDFSSPQLPNQPLIRNPSSGFMVSSFIRAPVLIKYRFHNFVDLQAIHLGLSIGTQKTMAFQIFVGDRDDDRSDLEIDRRVASIYFSNLDAVPKEFLISKRNCGIDQEMRSRIKDELDLKIDYFCKSFLLDRVKVLTIKITKAYYTPCLGFVKIFIRNNTSIGDRHFGSFGSEPTDQSAIDDFRKSGDGIDQQPGPSACEKSVDQPIISRDFHSDHHPSIPKEFIDPITHSSMSLPIILPSGQTIDRSTLEKYLDEEARFGRSANDPFTNVRFTDTSAPIPNNRLKERIDKFFLNYPDLAREENYGRTLCGGGEYEAWRRSVPDGKGVKRKLEGIGGMADVDVDGKKKKAKLEKAFEQSAPSSVERTDGSGSAPEYVRNLLHGLPSFL